MNNRKSKIWILVLLIVTSIINILLGEWILSGVEKSILRSILLISLNLNGLGVLLALIYFRPGRKETK